MRKRLQRCIFGGPRGMELWPNLPFRTSTLLFPSKDVTDENCALISTRKILFHGSATNFSSMDTHCPNEAGQLPYHTHDKLAPEEHLWDPILTSRHVGAHPTDT